MKSRTENLLEDFENGLVKGEEADGIFAEQKKIFNNGFRLGDVADF